jgi:hypothetical protein
LQKHRLGTPGKKSNYQHANQAKDGVAFPLKVAFGRDSSIRFKHLALFWQKNTRRFL